MRYSQTADKNTGKEQNIFFRASQNEAYPIEICSSIQQGKNMKPEKKEKNIKACLCPACPLYKECNDQQEEKFFCSAHPSGRLTNPDKTCICGGCAIFDKYDLSNGHFCMSEIIK